MHHGFFRPRDVGKHSSYGRGKVSVSLQSYNGCFALRFLRTGHRRFGVRGATPASCYFTADRSKFSGVVRPFAPEARSSCSDPLLIQTSGFCA
jgi:hypothetical protein